MNSFVLMATVIREPELRYTQNNQTAVCEFLVEFDGLRDDAPKESLKVVGWGNLADTINNTYHVGDRLLIEGRLSINTVERQEGFKEKRAELVAARIHPLDAGAEQGAFVPTSTPEPTSVPDPSEMDDIPF